MKKKVVKRSTGKLLSVLLVTAMLFSLAGCGKSKQSTTTVMDKEHVYSYEEVTLPVQLDDMRGIFCRNDRIYYVGTKYEEMTNTYLCSTAMDGSDAQNVVLKTGFEVERPDYSEEEGEAGTDEDAEIMPRVQAEEDVATEEAVEEDVATVEPVVDLATDKYVNIWMNSMVMDAKANLVANVEIYSEYTDENGEYVSESKMCLFCWNPQGEVLWSVDLREGLSEDDYLYVSSLFFDKEGLLWVYGNNRILVYDAQGNPVRSEKFAEEFNGTLYQTRAGELFILGWDSNGNKQVMRKIDKNTLQLGEAEAYPEAMYNYGIQIEGDKYDFILSDSTSIYSYNLGDAEPVELMDTIDSDLSSTGLSYVCLLSDTEFLAVYNDVSDWSIHVARFTKVPADQVKEKNTLLLASMYIDSDVRSRVVAFNKTNDTYRIQLKEYWRYSTDEDYMAGYTQLNNDIIAGKMPDILLVDSSMPFDSYVAKGLIADLYPLLDKDAELNKEDFLENILDAFSVDGKLYQLVPAFQVSSVVAKSSIVGDRTGWNMQEFKEVMDSLPEGAASFNDMTKSGILYLGLMMTRDEYIDKSTGKCSFDSQSFIDLLNYANEFPKEIDSSVYDDDNYWMQMESAYRENRTVLMNRYLASYYDFNRMEQGDFGEKVSLIGFPTENRNGNAIIANMSMALSAKSKNLEGAWEFVRYYLTDEYQSEIQYQFPIRKDALKVKEQEAQERPYWENEDGSKEYYDDTYYINGVEIIIQPMSAERAAEFTEFLGSLSLVGTYDDNMMNIVNEEAEAFFAGQKTAEEVAGII